MLAVRENGALIKTFTYDAFGKLRESSIDGQIRHYEYDATGNLIRIRSPEAVLETFEWDAENRLVAHTTDRTIEYQYDIEGNRTRRVDGGQSTEFLLDRQREYPELMATVQAGSLQQRFVLGLRSEAMLTAENTRFNHADAIGSTRLQSDELGAVLARHDYTPHGEMRGTASPRADENLFTGEQFDQNLGRYYLRARYYDPVTTRFLSVDPAEGKPGDPRTFEPHLYAHASPTNYTDPSGEFSFTEVLVTFGQISAIAGAGFGATGVLLAATVGANNWNGIHAFVSISTSKSGLGVSIGGSSLSTEIVRGKGGYRWDATHFIFGTAFSLSADTAAKNARNYLKKFKDKGWYKSAAKGQAAVSTFANSRRGFAAQRLGGLAADISTFGASIFVSQLAAHSPIDISVAQSSMLAPALGNGYGVISGPFLSATGTASLGLGFTYHGLAVGGSAAGAGVLVQGLGFGSSILSTSFTIKPKLELEATAGIAAPLSAKKTPF